MSPLVIVLLVVLALFVVAAFALNPVLRKRGDAAVEEATKQLGGADRVRLLEPKAVGFGSEPDEAGGLQGQGALAVSDDALVFVTWAPSKTFRLDRSTIGSVTTSAPDARVDDRAAVIVAFDHPDHPGATVSWRVPDIARWLDALGYDWGPEGRPDLDAERP